MRLADKNIAVETGHWISPNFQISFKAIIEFLELKLKSHSGIHMHPVGFLQVPLMFDYERLPSGDKYFLNIWKPAFVRPSDDRRLHDHVFNLRSRILWGAIENHVFEVVDHTRGSHKIMQADYGGGAKSRLVDTGRQVNFRLVDRQSYHQGEEYTLPIATFHDSVLLEDFAITLMKKFDIDPHARARVVTVETLDEHFIDREQFNEELAWAAVQETLLRLKSLAAAQANLILPV